MTKHKYLHNGAPNDSILRDLLTYKKNTLLDNEVIYQIEKHTYLALVGVFYPQLKHIFILGLRANK